MSDSNRFYGRIGQYELRGLLGRGGMATVYRAYQPSLDRDVAIKVIAAQYADEPTFRERFRREAVAIARLHHPHILAIYDFGEENGTPYIVTEYIADGTLQQRLGQPLRPRDVALVARHIGAALDYAHQHGIVHRDVKPANIFLAGTRAVLGDFGIAKEAGAGHSLTGTGLGLGSPEYMSPEQALGQRLDGRADLYSLAIVLYEALAGTKRWLAAHPTGARPRST